jgi:DUF1009 family protein
VVFAGRVPFIRFLGPMGLARNQKPVPHDAAEFLGNLFDKFTDAGIEVKKVTDFLPHLLPYGSVVDSAFTGAALGKIPTHDEFQRDFNWAIKEYSRRSQPRLSLGRTFIADGQKTFTYEGVFGTDGLIRRTGFFNRLKKTAWLPDAYGATSVSHHKPVLYKLPIKGAGSKIDLPAIGPITIKEARKNQIKGICVAANDTAIINRKETIHLADRLEIFIYAFCVD